MREYHYEIEVSDQQRKLARRAVNEFFETLDATPAADVEMAMPVLSFAGYKIAYGEYSENTSGKFLLAFDIAALTDERMNGITSRQLKWLLFNTQVYKAVTLALVEALHWAEDTDWHGYTPSNKRGVAQRFDVIMNAISVGIESLVAHAKRH